MTRDQAETVALQALTWIAGQEELSSRFAASTGASLGDLRNSVQEPAFLCGILEFLALEDAWVTGFCDAEGLACDVPMKALAALPGGRRDEWP